MGGGPDYDDDTPPTGTIRVEDEDMPYWLPPGAEDPIER
jgi:hypothetical protein